MLAAGVKENLIVSNPSGAVTLPRTEHPDIQIFTNGQQHEVMQAATATSMACSFGWP